MNMNNEQKNTYVKKQITAALLDLLKEKPLSDISISELTNKAEIGRVSFYRNYQSKEDILKEESDRLIKEWGRLYESNPESAPETLFPSLFDFYRDHRDFYTTLYNAGMSSIMMETIIGTMMARPISMARTVPAGPPTGRKVVPGMTKEPQPTLLPKASAHAPRDVTCRFCSV